MTRAIYFFGFLLLFSACGNTAKDGNAWIGEEENQWPQILLTNDMAFAGREPSYGASSFLIYDSKDTFACTVMHLLGEAMSVEPEVQPDSVNVLLEEWMLYPRTNTLSDDTVLVDKLVNVDNRDKDILLFKIKNKPKKVTPLKPSFEKLSPGDEVMIIGCEYMDFNCHQKVYHASFDSYEGSQIFVKLKDKFELQGFSGAPAINKNGEVVGVVSSGGEFEGNSYVVLESVTGIQQFLTP